MALLDEDGAEGACAGVAEQKTNSSVPDEKPNRAGIQAFDGLRSSWAMKMTNIVNPRKKSRR